MSPALPISVNPASELPVYRQLVRQIKDLIGSGKLTAGEQLPGHRELSAQLVIAPLTVKKAYDLLKQEDLITMGSGRGTFVKENIVTYTKDEIERRLDGGARQLAVEAQLMGLDEDSLQKIISKHFKDISQRPGDEQ